MTTHPPSSALAVVLYPRSEPVPMHFSTLPQPLGPLRRIDGNYSHLHTNCTPPSKSAHRVPRSARSSEHPAVLGKPQSDRKTSNEAAVSRRGSWWRGYLLVGPRHQ
ncbi:hypothetical protein ZHAS_00007361 [Anopheles sinensis]|uniref:Uncharacterized protein n=1 Tax=Anopheles sinensis TaxID=74873 RepID=A0A084VP13_ANOSI|nr:hypothetical protein ZHAS_00007361 [Anopheles sinensis]